MREIKITRSLFVQVDDLDFDWLNQFKWYAFKGKNTYYAARWFCNSNQLMHRLIMNTPKNMQTDHADRNGLNCQRYNLRICTNGQNQSNKIKWGKSKYKGVCLVIRKYKEREYKYFQSYICHNKHDIYLGCYKTDVEAALVYNEAAIKYHGEFANLNVI